jgi:mRNA-degrading endonuclease YafQ of YafQ-DinJ toxin-antitoxin module
MVFPHSGDDAQRRHPDHSFPAGRRQFREVYLEGDARIVYRGDLQPDALMA